ncbi:MAG: tetratricopeptide repeat protein [Candidatus Heimdallarchaeota archaeon]
MDEQPRTPNRDEKLAKEIAKKIVASGKLGEISTLEDVAMVLGDYVEDEIAGFRADIFEPEIGEKCITAHKKSTKKADPDDLGDFFDMLTGDPLSEEEQDMTATIRLAYSLLLREYKILNPLAYKTIIERMGFKQLKTVPKYLDAKFDDWTSKIIEQFVITNDTTAEKITNSVIQFFQMLIPDYSFKYHIWKDKKKYPLTIDKKGEDSLFYVFEINQIRGILFNIHYLLLNKLRRHKDYPKDPDFWFDLVILYEELDQKEKGYELGSQGLKLKPKEVGALSNLISYYLEKRRINDSLRFYKQTAHIYKAKKMLTIAEKSWKQIIAVEPNNKVNWQNLADVLTALGKTEEAEKCLQRISGMK